MSVEQHTARPRWSRLWGALLLVVFGLIVLIPALFSWPGTDEANYLVQARWVSEGMLPYRDFYDFITPAGQLFLGGVSALLGFSIPGIRLLVLFGWGLECWMLWRMGRRWLSRRWLVLFMGFMIVTDLRYPVSQHHFWSGLLALWSVYAVFRYLETRRPGYLLESALAVGLACWVTESAGGLVFLALLGFSLWSARSLKDWLSQWGRYWLVPFVLFSAAWLGWLFGIGLLETFWQDTFVSLLAGNYAKTTQFGYFVTLGDELHVTLLPLMNPLPLIYRVIFLLRVPIALHLLLIAVLPLIGLGVALLRWRHTAQDAALMLILMTGTALILSTFSYSTSMHLTSNGGLAFLLGWIVLVRLLQYKPGFKKLERLKLKAIPVFLFLVLLGMTAGALLQLFGGLWMPILPGTGVPMLWTHSREQAEAMLKLAGLMGRAREKDEPVYVIHRSPDVYLLDRVRPAARFTLVLPVYTPPVQEAEIVRDLRAHAPLYIIDDQALRTLDQDVRFAQYPPDVLQMPMLRDFIQAQYQPIAVLERYVVFRRKPSTPMP